MNITRRDFLAFTGFTVVGTLGGWYFKNQILPYEDYYLGSDFRKHQETIRTGVCGMCPAGCGIRVRLVDGVPVRITGNADCPISEGGLCPRGQMGLELHFNPDRLAGPLERSGSGDTAQWKSITWDEGLNKLREEIVAAQASQESSREKSTAIMALCPDERSLRTESFARALEKLGSADGLIPINSQRDNATLTALQRMCGYTDWPVYDLERSDLLIVFDTPLFSGWGNSTSTARMYGDFRRGQERRGHMIFVGSRRGQEGRVADEYIEVNPYTSATLALGLAHVLLREGLYNSSFVKEHCAGFADYRDVVLAKYTTDYVSDQTGVPIETINTLARRIAASERPLALGERRPQGSHVAEQMAYVALNAILGSVGVRGGLVLQENLPLNTVRKAKSTVTDNSSSKSLIASRVSEALHNKNLLPEVLLIDRVNCGLLSTTVPGWDEFIQQIPFVVSFSAYPDAGAQLADMVLPDVDFLERAQDVAGAPSIENPSFGVTDPVVKPLTNGKDTTHVLMNFLSEEFLKTGAISWSDAEKEFHKLRDELHRELFELKRGMVFDTKITRDWMENMESGGWWSSDLKDFASFESQLNKKGGWTDPFVSVSARRKRALGTGRQIDLQPLIKEISANSLEREMPAPRVDGAWSALRVVPMSALALSALPYGNVPHLLEFAEPGLIYGWSPWLELHPELAAQLKVAEDDMLEVQTADGVRTCRVVINNTLHPEIGSIPLEMFGLGNGQWVRENMRKPLVESKYDAQRKNTPSTTGIALKVRKV